MITVSQPLKQGSVMKLKTDKNFLKTVRVKVLSSVKNLNW